jgi:hypothetical protein
MRQRVKWRESQVSWTCASLLRGLEFALEELLNQGLENALAEGLVKLRFELCDDPGNDGVEGRLVQGRLLCRFGLRDGFVNGTLDGYLLVWLRLSSSDGFGSERLGRSMYRLRFWLACGEFQLGNWLGLRVSAEGNYRGRRGRFE